MKLRSRLKFFCNNGAGKITVLRPADDQLIKTDEEFYCEVKAPFDDGIVDVYIGDILLKSIEIHNGIAEDYVVIPDGYFGFGTTFIVEGSSEIPVNEEVPQTLNFKSDKSSGKVKILLKAKKDYFFGDCKVITDTVDNEPLQSFGNVSIEVDISDEPFNN